MIDDLDQLAGEYVLGTLPLGERQRFAERLESDPEARAAVEFWEQRFSTLVAAVPPLAPDGRVWENIKAAIDAEVPAAPGTASGDKPASPPPDPADPAPAASPAANDNVIALRRRVAIWRSSTFAGAAIAASLLAFILLAPGTLAPVPVDDATNRYVAVVDTGGREPALIAEVDTASGTIRVRSIGAQTPMGRSLELWHVGENGTPRSLGILDASLDRQVIEDPATRGAIDGQIAVTVEPAGGSPSGAPTGPIVYSGRLIAVE